MPMFTHFIDEKKNCKRERCLWNNATINICFFENRQNARILWALAFRKPFKKDKKKTADCVDIHIYLKLVNLNFIWKNIWNFIAKSKPKRFADVSHFSVHSFCPHQISINGSKHKTLRIFTMKIYHELRLHTNLRPVLDQILYSCKREKISM